MKKESLADEGQYPDFPLGAILHYKGVNQSELARRTGMEATYINRLVRGRCNPTWKTIMLIALHLNLDLGDLYAGEICEGHDAQDR